ncbi:unnamed protein product [Amoebophrya sp. A25]|nr:unnamed protein product [Amoebophrya sp. A25]|eukprot:GSA25T00022499001.1
MPPLVSSMKNLTKTKSRGRRIGENVRNELTVSRDDGKEFILHVIHRVIYDSEECRLSVCTPGAWFADMIRTGRDEGQKVNFCLAIEGEHGWRPLMSAIPMNEW